MSQRYIPKEHWQQVLEDDFSLRGTGIRPLGLAYNRWMYRLRAKVLTGVCRQYRLPVLNARVLDLGCGVGFYIKFWEHVGAREIVGIDIAEAAVCRLQHTMPRWKFYRADIGSEFLPVKAPFDIVSAFDVLFHLVEEKQFEQALGNIARALRPGGVALLSDLFVHAPVQGQFHFCPRTYAVYRDALERNGLQILGKHAMFCLMNEPLDVQRPWAVWCARYYWRLLTRIIRTNKTVGSFCGGCLFALDSLLVKIVADSPTTELLVCQKL